MENYAGEGDDAFRGRDRPLRVTNPEPHDPLFTTIIKAAGQVGIRHQALRYALFRQGMLAMTGALDPGVRPLARGPGGARPDAGMDPDADGTHPARPENIAPVGSDPLCPCDASGE